MKREAAAVIILRRKGQSINNISNFLGRSCSFVYRILKNLTKFDLRKLPAAYRIKNAFFNRRMLEKLWNFWEMWILGEGAKPP